MSEGMSRPQCHVCEATFVDHRALEKHVNKKNKCVPPGQPKFHCSECNITFEHRPLLTQHLKTKKHLDAVARQAEPGSSTSIDNSNNANHCDNSTTNNITHNITHNNNQTYTLSNPPPRPRMFGRSDVSHIIDLTFKELDHHLKLRSGTGLTPFLNMFKLIHLNDDAPKNHNVLMESKDSDFALTFRQRHWRLIGDPERIVMDCLHQTAIQYMEGLRRRRQTLHSLCQAPHLDQEAAARGSRRLLGIPDGAAGVCGWNIRQPMGVGLYSYVMKAGCLALFYGSL